MDSLTWHCFHFTSQFIQMTAVQPERITLSKRVQAAAAEAITQCHRSLTVCEIEHFFALCDRKLSPDVSKKCQDHIRIILSLSRARTFGKFISLLETAGPYHPIIYLGLMTVASDLHVWSLLVSKSREPRQKLWPPSKTRPVLKPRCVRQPVGNTSHLVANDASSRIVEACTKLSTEETLALLQALGFLNEAVAFDVPPLAIVDAILCSLPSVRDAEELRARSKMRGGQLNGEVYGVPGNVTDRRTFNARKYGPLKIDFAQKVCLSCRIWFSSQRHLFCDLA
jgi:hypothetical protein